MRRSLAIVALGLGALAAFADSPYAADRTSVNVQQLARMIERREDHVTAEQLATWIKERHPALRVIDLRSAAGFETYHVPTAERIPLGELASTPLRHDQTIVLYSDGGAHAAQGWVFLRALGYSHIFFLAGGLQDWLDDIMSPTLAANATPADRAEFARLAELSRYFGGAPRIMDARTGAPGAAALPPLHGSDDRVRPATSDAVQRIRRRGC